MQEENTYRGSPPHSSGSRTLLLPFRQEGSSPSHTFVKFGAALLPDFPPGITNPLEGMSVCQFGSVDYDPVVSYSIQPYELQPGIQ